MPVLHAGPLDVLQEACRGRLPVVVFFGSLRRPYRQVSHLPAGGIPSVSACGPLASRKLGRLPAQTGPPVAASLHPPEAQTYPRLLVESLSTRYTNIYRLASPAESEGLWARYGRCCRSALLVDGCHCHPYHISHYCRCLRQQYPSRRRSLQKAYFFVSTYSK